MKIAANSVRPGYVLRHSDRQWLVLKINLITPGKGGAFIQVEMRDITSGSKTNERWRTCDTVEKLDCREILCQYLFKENLSYTFMKKDDFEQFSLPEEQIKLDAPFLQEAMDIYINFVEEHPLSISLPKNMVFTVMETEPAVRGQTATGSYKPALLENGIKIMVPPFIEVGNPVVVNTEDRTYIERAK